MGTSRGGRCSSREFLAVYPDEPDIFWELEPLTGCHTGRLSEDAVSDCAQASRSAAWRCRAARLLLATASVGTGLVLLVLFAKHQYSFNSGLVRSVGVANLNEQVADAGVILHAAAELPWHNPFSEQAKPSYADIHSCSHYGCGKIFDASQQCQCNVECQRHSDCCADFYKECEVPQPGQCSDSQLSANCIVTRCCNDPASVCFQRDATWAMCARSCKPGRHSDDAAAWSCKMLGQPQLPSFFCFLAMLTHGAEEQLVRSQFGKRVGIFSCDDFAVFSDVEVYLGPNVRTLQLDSLSSHILVPGALTASWVNRAPFARAWDEVAAYVLLGAYEWVVKVDPDTVFFPHQLRLHLRAVHAEFKRSLPTGVYLKNCLVPSDTGLELFGSAEVLSRQALLRYVDRGDACNFAQSGRMGEDMWLQWCLDDLNVTAFKDTEVLSDAYCPAYQWQPAPCTFGRAAYHPLKSVSQWWTCWQQVMAADIVPGLTL